MLIGIPRENSEAGGCSWRKVWAGRSPPGRRPTGAVWKVLLPPHMISSNVGSGVEPGIAWATRLRQAALLGKAWGMTDACIVNTIVQGACYFTGLEHLEVIDARLRARSSRGVGGK